jgi:hypothetical protein
VANSPAPSTERQIAKARRPFEILSRGAEILGISKRARREVFGAARVGMRAERRHPDSLGDADSTLECGPAGEPRVPFQAFLNTKELVKFCDPFAPASRPSLDVASAGRNRQICDKGVLGLA